jgi:hypothetical protein
MQKNWKKCGYHRTDRRHCWEAPCPGASPQRSCELTPILSDDDTIISTKYSSVSTGVKYMTLLRWIRTTLTPNLILKRRFRLHVPCIKFPQWTPRVPSKPHPSLKSWKSVMPIQADPVCHHPVSIIYSNTIYK